MNLCAIDTDVIGEVTTKGKLDDLKKANGSRVTLIKLEMTDLK